MSECMHVTMNRYVCVRPYLFAPFVFIQLSMFCFFPSLFIHVFFVVSLLLVSTQHVLHTRIYICSGKSFRVVDMHICTYVRIHTYVYCMCLSFHVGFLFAVSQIGSHP